MEFFISLDIALFRFINGSLQNSLFDAMMPFISGNALFFPAVFLFALWLIRKCGARGRLFVFFIVMVVALGDGFICNTMKHAVQRPRPFHVLQNVHIPPGIGETNSGSMPSSHTANWFAATMVAYIFYRRSWRFMLPMSLLVGLSRIYNGVHYPSDVLVGVILGAGYGAAFVWLANTIWQTFGKKWFPLWHEKLPSLVDPKTCEPTSNFKLETSNFEVHWLRLGYVVIALLLVARLSYLASGKIELSEDEAYQWLWSKHLALSYYSKPLMIALAQWFGTHLWGDNEFGVRFLSPLISATLSLLTLRFLTQETNARLGLLAVLALNCTPMLAGGSILMTIDPLLILFWTAAMFAGWRAVQRDGKTSTWCLAGFLLGLSFLSKYAALYQIICWALFFFLWKPARVHLRKPGPYLALVVFLLCTIPVLIWNSQHHWITVQHVGDNAGRTEPWSPTLKYFFDFLGTQALVLNPIFFVGMLWALFAFWKRKKNPVQIFFFCMGAPVFLGYALFTAYKRVNANWVAPSVLPLLCLALIYWEERLREGLSSVKTWLVAGLLLGLTMAIIGHDTNLISKIAGNHLPEKMDISRRVRGWKETARTVGTERQKLLAEGKPVFIIGAHYGLVGEISFYLPEARTGAQLRQPLAYYLTSDRPKNQLYFWPEYRYRDYRKGQNAIFVEEVEATGGDKNYFSTLLQKEFHSVGDLGTRDVLYRGRLFRRLHFYACRDLQ